MNVLTVFKLYYDLLIIKNMNMSTFNSVSTTSSLSYSQCLDYNC